MAQMATSEQFALEQMEPRWRRLGYQVMRNPKPDQLPSFLRGVTPDAIALGRSPQLVIEVLRARSAAADEKIRQLTELLKGQNAWRLEVVYLSSEGEPLETVTRQEIRGALENARELSDRDTRISLLLAWASLEAIGRHLEPELAARSLSAGSLVDLLISTGHLPQDEGGLLRKAGEKRNAIAHGQLNVEPDTKDVRHVIEIAERLAA